MLRIYVHIDFKAATRSPVRIYPKKVFSAKGKASAYHNMKDSKGNLPEKANKLLSQKSNNRNHPISVGFTIFSGTIVPIKQLGP
ncbi:hypothetical protein DSO57_1035013 [Entomophthora muscae]|uniref:Uncharacterized protein n=1 Tax=Entomophthora muscae TaxID=34485 RepID=A0ACC2SNR1_9FUNG|nr:hypothetical protein DSO57_1035013 [Entomophthora muscae]